MAKRDKRLRLGMEFVCSDKRKQEIEFNMLDYCFRCMLNSKYKKYEKVIFVMLDNAYIRHYYGGRLFW